MSIGIAMSTAKRMTPEDILRDADLAMYHAKGKGKARYEIFDKSMNAPAQERMDLELDLRNAVARGEFVLHYQPILELPTGRIVEMEALVRWKHPRRGLLFPGDFIGLSEETGLIVPLGRWVLHEACRQTRQWQLATPGLNLAISVNLSARQLQQPGLVEEIAAALRETRLDPGALRLEITETVVMHDAPATLAKLEALKALGVQLAIDDFGTGLLVARLPQALPGGHAQDRPVIREGHRPERGGQRDRARGHHGGQEPRPLGDRRGDRERRPARAPPLARLRPRPGLLFRQADAERPRARHAGDDRALGRAAVRQAPCWSTAAATSNGH